MLFATEGIKGHYESQTHWSTWTYDHWKWPKRPWPWKIYVFSISI